MTHGSLFSGIGGFDLAAESVGWENLFHCEWNPFGQRVLKYYWPKAKTYGDIDNADFTFWKGKIDVLSGGFPCQPYSKAGHRKGDKDDRHKWPQMLRAVREIQPSWIVGENVRGIINWNGGLVFDEVQADLEAEGYEITPFLLPACSVGADHRRDRIWFIAHSSDFGLQRRKQRVQETQRAGYDEKDMPACRLPEDWKRDGLPRPRIFRDDDGLSQRLVDITISAWRDESIKGYGNAIVPKLALQIFNTINQYENESF